MGEIQDVYNLPPKTDPSYTRKKQILTWYVDVYLPKAAGAKNYGINVRAFKLLVSGMVVMGGVKKTIVSIQSEAFGWLIYENCYEKWVLIVKKKKVNPRWKVPTYNKLNTTTHQWHATKWSDRNAGKGSGWSPTAIEMQNTFAEKIKAFRDQDANDTPKNKVLRICRQLIRDKHGINDNKKKATRKRNRDGSIQAGVIHHPKVIEISDDAKSDDENFSVHSEISSGEKEDHQE